MDYKIYHLRWGVVIKITHIVDVQNDVKFNGGITQARYCSFVQTELFKKNNPKNHHRWQTEVCLETFLNLTQHLSTHAR